MPKMRCEMKIIRFNDEGYDPFVAAEPVKYNSCANCDRSGWQFYPFLSSNTIFSHLKSASYSLAPRSSSLAHTLQFTFMTEREETGLAINYPQPKETTLKSSTRNKAEGALHQAKGSAKEITGKICNNAKLQYKGSAEKIAGKVQSKLGQVKKAIGK